MRKTTPALIKRSFSLLEIVVAILLIVTAASVVAFNAFQLIAKQHYTHSVETVHAQLAHLQLLSLIYKSDSAAEIKIENNKATLILHTPEKVLSHLNGKEIGLKGIATLKLAKKCVKRLYIRFDARGASDSCEPIGLENGDRSSWIDLTTPIQIKLSKTYPKAKIGEDHDAPIKPSFS